MSKLNDRQREAVHYIDGPLLVLAGAGSGKTSVITRKMAYLIEKCGIPARHIAAVTFTNKAAREMKERVSQLVKGQAAKGLTVSTFHNLGMNILRKEYRALNYKSGFSIFDSQDAQALIRDLLMQEHGGETDKAELIQSRISNWKNDFILPEHAIQLAESPADMLCAQAYARYQNALKAYNALDFDDLIMLPAQLFDDRPDILDKWQQKIRYMLVDEYQDTNTSQYRLIKQLVGNRQGLTVVGDDDQSIYAWRGAKPENLSLLGKDYPHLKVVMLEQNYRSTARILKAANVVIANNPHELNKALWSELGYGDPIRIIKCRNEDAECERVVTEILSHKIASQQGRFGNYAVLYRGNHQSRLLELKLQAHQIPYKLSGGTSFFGRNEIKDIMAYLRLIINQSDDNAFLRIINVPRRKIGTSTLESLGRYATEREISLYSACEEFGLAQQLPEAALKRLQEFTQWLDKLRRRCYEDDAITAIRQLCNDINYLDWLIQNSSSVAVAERRMANVTTLIDSLEKNLKNDEENAGFENAISRLVLRDLLERQEDEQESPDQVQLMTLHAAKGLEFPYVFMIGMEEGLLPHQNSIDDGMVEEERRLCYVGITRAQKVLTLSYCAKRKSFGQFTSCEPSRFLDELPKDDVEWEGRGDNNPAVNQKKADQTLASLKSMFD
ncbi:ATP-dependent DNA helicase Rep [Spongiibacter sp. IMCC21906]|uniref:DNA helicase Rep n=1 Tax=Spongiibacter sp. IMCC21906 TaxID=1620392 RepID=UPI00062DD65C|nr:DNA helicase Rep [Spongiibacter sp. IMCC21906]AKH67894.1 ATP-dependent DNA helicase Rep [Spongiibacter sp. IMCC21906]